MSDSASGNGLSAVQAELRRMGIAAALLDRLLLDDRAIDRMSRESRIPVIKHLYGICHVYIDDGADAQMAVSIAYNAKTEKYVVFGNGEIRHR